MFEIINTKILYDKCENMEQLYDKFYYPLLVEYKELKKHLEVPETCNLKTLEDYKSYYDDTTREQILADTYIDYCAYVNLAHKYSELKKQLKGTTHCFDEEEHKRLKKQLHEASLTIQEMVEQNIWCPSSCDKLEKLLKENKDLKKQLEVSNELFIAAQGALTKMKLRDEVNGWRKEYQDTYKDVRIEIKEYKAQQKEFIKWLEEKEKRFDMIGDPINSGACCGILQKYKEIIGDK